MISWSQPIILSEVLAENKKLIADPAGEFDDYIELYNAGNTSFDLSGYFLSDDKDTLQKWAFPKGTKIAAGAYLLVWADNDLSQEGLHTRFKLSPKGESIYLSDRQGNKISKLKFGRQFKNVSYSRVPEVDGKKRYTLPSPLKKNGPVCVLLVRRKDKKQDIKLKTDPMKSTIVVQRSDTKPLKVEITTKKGQKIRSLILEPAEQNLDLSFLEPGKYTLKLGKNTYRIVKQ